MGDLDLSRRVRVGVVGCGSVARSYLPDLAARPFVELASVCDADFARARAAADEHRVPQAHGDLDGMLAGAPFELLVDLTSMPQHYAVNRAGLDAGRHVWSEKPLASTVAEGRELIALAAERGVRLWAAPTCVTSPQFAFMARALADGRLGRVCAGHASYGHCVELWSPAFYQRGGGCLADLGVYNLTTLTGLLGPARSVVALEGIAVPVRQVQGQPVQVEAEDNVMLLLDHGGACFSHVQTGFVYFGQQPDTAAGPATIEIVGTEGRMSLCGWDWAPRGVLLATRDEPQPAVHCPDPGDYTWQNGASQVARCLATGQSSPMTAEHALHVLEVMNACHESQRTGRRVELTTDFPWPIQAGQPHPRG